MDFVAAHSGEIASVIFFVLFVGIALWAFWPGNKKSFEAQGDIPLKGDDNGRP